MSDIFKKIKENKERKKQGKMNTIPFNFERVADSFPGWEKGKYYIITANSGVGKTKLTKYLTILNNFYMCKKYSIKYKVLYFALEESKSEFEMSILSALMKIKYDISVDTATLKSLGKKTLSDELEEKLYSLRDLFDEVMEKVEVIDFISNPTGIYKHVKMYAHTYGKDIVEKRTITDNKTGLEEEKEFIVGYEADDPEEFVFVIVDHVSLLQTEMIRGNKMTSHEVMGYWSKEYALKNICKRFNYIYVGVQQQTSAKEELQFTFKGTTIEKKLEPTLDGLGENKTLQREADVVISLFAPNRHDITEHAGYNIQIFNDSYRSMKFLKDRHYGCASKRVGLLFDGASMIFKELPKPDQIIEPELTRNFIDKHIKTI